MIPDWVLIAVVGAVTTALLGVLIKLWGSYFKKLVVKVFFTIEDDINQKSEEDYRIIMSSTVAALKERIFLLEKWKDEAVSLDKRVDELEGVLIVLKNQKDTSEAELTLIRLQLDSTKEELKKKEAAIQSLRTELDSAYKIISDNQSSMADNAQKIQALLHQAGGEEPD